MGSRWVCRRDYGNTISKTVRQQLLLIHSLRKFNMDFRSRWWKLPSTSPGSSCDPWRTSIPRGAGRNLIGSSKTSNDSSWYKMVLIAHQHLLSPEEPGSWKAWQRHHFDTLTVFTISWIKQETGIIFIFDLFFLNSNALGHVFNYYGPMNSEYYMNILNV